MFFNSIKIIFYILFSTVRLAYLIVITTGKIIYYLIKKLYYAISYSLLSNTLRFPTLLFFIGFITSTKVIILFTIYYLYLIHRIVKKNNIYSTIKINIVNAFYTLKNRYTINNNLKGLSCENKIINNLFLEGEYRSIYVYHLVITAKGLYNIVPFQNTDTILSNSFISYISAFRELIEDILPNKIPIFNVLATNSASISELISDCPFKVLSLDEIESYIENNPYKKHNNSIQEICEILYENKVWIIDKIIDTCLSIIKAHKKLILFVILCPVIYIIYILTLLFITDTINSIAHHIFERFIGVFNFFR